MRRRELLFAFLVIALLCAAWGLDRLVRARSIPPPPARAAQPLLSAAWYCPSPVGQVPTATVATANLGPSTAHTRRSGTAGASEEDLAGGALALVAAAPTPATGTVYIEAFSQPVVTHLSVLASTIGGATSRCSAQPATRWLFGMASTALGMDSYVIVANPFPEAAEVAVRILTAAGDHIPPGLDHLEVPAASQVTVFLGDFVPTTPSFGLDVTANRGRIIVGRLMRASTRDGIRGLALDVGVTQPSARWILPGGASPLQGEENLVVANPSDHEALVSVLVQTQGPDAPQGPQQVPIPAGSQTTIKLSDSVPAGTHHGTIVSSTNGVPVVVERETISGQGAGRSFADVLGVPAPASGWLVAAGSPVGGTDTLAVLADGQDAATFSISVVTPTGTATPADLSGLKAVPGTRASFDLTPLLGGKPAMLLVQASTGSVAVENDVDLPAAFRQTLQTVGVPIG